MPLTAMSDMPDGLQALKRENVLGDEHVLGAHMWTGEPEHLGFIGADPVGGGIDIPQSTGIPIHVPDFKTIQSPGDFLNVAANIYGATVANKLAKKGQLRTGAPASHGGGGGGSSILGDIGPYAPWLIVGAVGLGILAYAKSGKGRD